MSSATRSWPNGRAAWKFYSSGNRQAKTTAAENQFYRNRADCSEKIELPKLHTRVRFPSRSSSVNRLHAFSWNVNTVGFTGSFTVGKRDAMGDLIKRERRRQRAIECVAAMRPIRMNDDGAPSFFYATDSFSSPELSNILCRTTVVSHVFSRGCCSALRPHGLSLA
jgi:hypothetical protein